LAGIGFGILCLFGSAAARAANLCPWLTEATASGLLGSSATGSYVESTAGQPAVCTFVAVDSKVTRTLTINVDVTPEFNEHLASILHGCVGETSAVQAIGNEASVCMATDRKSPLSELLAGRVRDQVFSITMKTTAKNDPDLDEGMLRSKVLVAAEQVSGNLF
jgi:hypothetical protein